jgi:hypothetical protein
MDDRGFSIASKLPRIGNLALFMAATGRSSRAKEKKTFIHFRFDETPRLTSAAES